MLLHYYTYHKPSKHIFIRTIYVVKVQLNNANDIASLYFGYALLGFCWMCMRVCVDKHCNVITVLMVVVICSSETVDYRTAAS